MSDLGFNVWGAVASVIGTIALIPVLLPFIKSRLPSAMITGLIDVHKETQELFDTAIRDGLITDSNDLYLFKVHLTDAAIRVDELRAEVYAIATWQEDVAKWWYGVSRSISSLRNNLNKIRVQLAKRNSKERKKLASQGHATAIAVPMHREGVDDSPAYASLTCMTAGSERLALKGRQPLEIPRTKSGPRDRQSAPHAPPQAGINAKPDDLSDHHAAELLVDAAIDGTRRHSHAPDREQQGVPSPVGLSQHVLSNGELQSLLSLALVKPWTGRRLVAPRQAPMFPPVWDHGSRRGIVHPRLLLLRLVRRMYGLSTDSRTVGKRSGSDLRFALDPEALKPQYTGESDTDDDSSDWEECQ
ncbi:hypothetical protein BN946_scf184993.g20 [Trametes cinnabarina]|uniref:Uncharacterized protein n=1 Tax=Pycnoporus cinnabarinus TaxID=5643 RepID=A0A060ST94_PYCCI|nr:hypothetical protein BN946_scf184993.g20 [Trametes cinnabarina]